MGNRRAGRYIGFRAGVIESAGSEMVMHGLLWANGTNDCMWL
jgi:hypothetical protein